MTVDVENFSIPLNRCDPDTGREVYESGLPPLLDLLSKYDVRGTFYFTGEMAKMFPESVELVLDGGHEIGCHGYDHSPEMAFDVLSYDKQVAELKKAKNVLENIAGRIHSFRAPALRINENTIKALKETGFNSDSSICSQRFDGPFTFGSRRKLKWLRAPRMPYFMSYDSIIRKGRTDILEIPISAFLVPYIGTTMRIFPGFIDILQKFIFFESRKTDKPVVFLFHPNECLSADRIITTRRGKNVFEHLFADVLRQKMKLRNLGMVSLKLLENSLKTAKNEGFDFISAGDYRQFFGRSQ